MVQDLSSYYLVSYRSSNVKPDGAFRRVDVTTTRRGVTVRARRGYRATTAVELDRQRTDAAMAGQTVLGALGAVPAAIASLRQLKPAMPVRTRVAYGPSSGGRVRLWAVAEIDTPTVRQGVWLGGGSVDAALSGADNRALASAEAAMAAGQRSVVLDLGDLEPSQAPTSLLVRLRPRGDDKAMQDVLSLPPFGASGDVGVPLLLRRGSTTGMRFVPTADPQFRRTERLRLELARASPPASVAAVLLDRMGTPIALPLVTSTRADGGITWAAAEMSLAPLAHGDYVIKLTVDGRDAVTAIRVVPTERGFAGFRQVASGSVGFRRVPSGWLAAQRKRQREGLQRLAVGADDVFSELDGDRAEPFKGLGEDDLQHTRAAVVVQRAWRPGACGSPRSVACAPE